MDYHSIHGHDISSFDAPGTPSQALDELKDPASTHVSTGLNSLDKALLRSSTLDPTSSSHGGVKRGQVTEIWGTPGAGKTAIGIQLATNVLCAGDGVVWIGAPTVMDSSLKLFALTTAIDCFQDVDRHRIAAVHEAAKNAQGSSDNTGASGDGQTNFMHYSCMTLPHLLALISRPTAKSIAANVSLIVISSMSALVNAALPRSQDRQNGPKAGSKGLTLTAKRLQALRSIMDSLRKLAATRNCAVVVLSQCATRMQSERGATLVAAVNATVWEQGVSTRIVLFKDWMWQNNKPSSIFLAGIQKLDGKESHDAVEHLAAFKVQSAGVSEVKYEANPSSMTAPKMPQQKRKRRHTEFEVPDSEDDEDYGWADEDEAVMPPPPPQWQGSEDILLGQEVGRSGEDTDDEHRSAGEATEASDTEERLS